MDKYNFTNKEGSNIAYYKWGKLENPKAIVQIVHGMSEWAGRYDYFAEKLVEEGYLVYSHDHSGHGNSSKDFDGLGYIGNNDRFYLMLLKHFS